MQVESLNEELQHAWRELEQQPGGLHCIDMLVQPRQHININWGCVAMHIAGVQARFMAALLIDIYVYEEPWGRLST